MGEGQVQREGGKGGKLVRHKGKGEKENSELCRSDKPKMAAE